MSSINQLLKNTAIWQASQKKVRPPVLSTGYPTLDRALHYSGWPQGAISEVLLSAYGSGEIRLISPLLVKLNQGAGYICWINPPFLPHAPALVDLGLDLNRMIIVRTQSVNESIWASQQAMRSGACAATLIWLPKKALDKQIRKLNLAAKDGHCWGIIFRDQSLQKHTSAAALRIVIEKKQKKLDHHKHQLHIIKQPGGWSGQKVCLDFFPEKKNWTASVVNQWPIFSVNHQLIKADNQQVQLPFSKNTPAQKKLVSQFQQTSPSIYH